MTTEDTAKAIQEHERLGEAEYAAMYEARTHRVKNHYEDARCHFAKAIALARAAGLKEEIARLTVRLDNIIGVYDSQFRYFR